MEGIGVGGNVSVAAPRPHGRRLSEDADLAPAIEVAGVTAEAGHWSYPSRRGVGLCTNGA